MSRFPIDRFVPNTFDLILLPDNKDLSAPNLTPTILFRAPCRLLGAEKAGGLLLKPPASRLSCGDPHTGPPAGISASAALLAQTLVSVNTRREKLLTLVARVAENQRAAVFSVASC